MTDTRAVSNVLGYVLLFSVVLLSITATFTFGIDAIGDASDRTVQQSGQHSMQTLGDRIETLRESNTTVQQGQLRAGRGTIGYGEQTRVTVSVAGSPELQTDFRPIQYRFDGTTVAYEAGGIVRTSDDGGAVLVDEPTFVFDDDAVILPIVTTEPAAQRQVSGGTVTTTFERVASEQAYFGTSAAPVTLSIETTEGRATVWERTLSEAGATCSRPTPDTAACTYTPSNADATIIVREFRVNYEFEA